MIRIFQDFGELLNERFSQNVITTEDSVRYTFFAALLKAGIAPHQVVLEYPHPAIERAKIDTWLPNYEDGPCAFEFKYDRDPPSGMNQPKTQKAGSVFRDLHRQVQVAKAIGARTYFVYVTSNEMAVYFRNPNNGYADFWHLGTGAALVIDGRYFANKPQTFLTTLGDTFEAKLSGVFGRTLAGDHFLRAYEVAPGGQ